MYPEWRVVFWRLTSAGSWDPGTPAYWSYMTSWEYVTSCELVLLTLLRVLCDVTWKFQCTYQLSLCSLRAVPFFTRAAVVSVFCSSNCFSKTWREATLCKGVWHHVSGFMTSREWFCDVAAALVGAGEQIHCGSKRVWHRKTVFWILVFGSKRAYFRHNLLSYILEANLSTWQLSTMQQAALLQYFPKSSGSTIKCASKHCD